MVVDFVGVAGWKSCSAGAGGCKFGMKPLIILSRTTPAGANMGMINTACGTCTTSTAPVGLVATTLCACLSPTALVVNPTSIAPGHRPCPTDVSMSRGNVWSSFCGRGSACVLWVMLALSKRTILLLAIFCLTLS